ncbi:MAG: hypothetical protein J5605_09040, partial [Bacteroidales bacterium]|nr:hypothetical protein [Bacteroidales bacterium]
AIALFASLLVFSLVACLPYDAKPIGDAVAIVRAEEIPSAQPKPDEEVISYINELLKHAK